MGKPGVSPETGRQDGFVAGRERRTWEDPAWDIGDPEKCVWPQGSSAPSKEGRDPDPAWCPGGTAPAVFVPPNKDAKELPRASVDVCKRLLYSARSWSLPRDVFSRQRWKHCLFIVNNAPPRPLHCPSRGAPVRRPSGVGLRCRGPGRRADLKGVRGLGPLGTAPGIATRVCGRGRREPSWRACSRPRGPEAPFASSAPGARPAPRACERPFPLPHGPLENYTDPRRRPRGNSEAPASPPNPRLGPWEPRAAWRAETFFFLQRGWRWPHAWLPALSPCARRQIGSGLAAGRAGSEDGRLPGDRGPRSAASCRGGGRAGAEGPRADRPPAPAGPRLQWAPPRRRPAGRSFIFVRWMGRGT